MTHIKKFRNVSYPSETRIKLNSLEISFAQNICFSCQIVLKICTEHDSDGSDTAVLCASFQNDLTTEEYVMRKRPLAKFEFTMAFGWVFLLQ